jgi:hypothetical protein
LESLKNAWRHFSWKGKKIEKEIGTRLAPLNKLTNVNGMLTPWRGVTQHKIISPRFLHKNLTTRFVREKNQY